MRTALLAAVVAALVTAATVPADAVVRIPDRKGCVPAIATSAPVGTTACPGIRPGALVSVPSEGVFCTLGYVYTDAKARSYITTAGHCVVPEGVERRWASGRGPEAQDASGKTFGRFVYGVQSGDYDISVIQLAKGVRANPQVCHFGGPTGVDARQTTSLVQIQLYGHAVGIGDALPARSGIALGMPEATTVYALAPSFQGDSGGPVLLGGKAIGYVTAIGAAVGTAGGMPYGGAVFITRSGPQIARASKAMGTTLRLRTAPLL